MGILSNTVSICHFAVAGELPPQSSLFEWVSDRLALNSFTPIDQGAEETSVGWVHLDDPRSHSFDSPRAFWRDHYLTFSLRKDLRKIPAALLKAYVQVEEHQYLEANPGLRRVPKAKREEIRETVRTRLLAKTLPVPAVYDAVWDTRSGIVTFANLGGKAVDLFDTHFRKTFEGLRLVAVHPYARAESVAGEDLLPALQRANRAGGESVLHAIRDNRWIGWDFLLWLLYGTMNGAAEYRVSRPGPALDGEAFTAWVDDRLILVAQGESGPQKVTVAGPQDNFEEVKTALRRGKFIEEATLHLEQGDEAWKLTLKGELFQFASFRCPSVRIEKDGVEDEESEREAVFYERMALLERGLQLFDSLFLVFLRERIGDDWSKREESVRQWLAA